MVLFCPPTTTPPRSAEILFEELSAFLSAFPARNRGGNTTKISAPTTAPMIAREIHGNVVRVVSRPVARPSKMDIFYSVSPDCSYLTGNNVGKQPASSRA